MRIRLDTQEALGAESAEARIPKNVLCDRVTGWARLGYPAYAGANGEVVDEREILHNQAEFLKKNFSK